MNVTPEMQRVAEDAVRNPSIQGQRMPVCPYCEIDPCTLISIPCAMGDMLSAVFACGSCRKIISVCPVAIGGAPVIPTRQQQQQQEPSRLVKPF